MAKRYHIWINPYLNQQTFKRFHWCQVKATKRNLYTIFVETRQWGRATDHEIDQVRVNMAELLSVDPAQIRDVKFVRTLPFEVTSD